MEYSSNLVLAYQDMPNQKRFPFTLEMFIHKFFSTVKVVNRVVRHMYVNASILFPD